MPTIKPLDKKILIKYVPKVKKIVTVEENYLAGGFGSSILEFVSDNFSKYTYKIKRVGIKNKFIKNYSDQETLLDIYGLNVNNLVKTMQALTQKLNIELIYCTESILQELLVKSNINDSTPSVFPAPDGSPKDSFIKRSTTLSNVWSFLTVFVKFLIFSITSFSEYIIFNSLNF